MKKIAILLVLLFILTLGGEAQEQKPMSGGWRRFAPFQYLTERRGLSRLDGLDIEMTRAIFQRTDFYPTFKEQPWADQLKSIESGDLDFVMGATRTAEREQYAHFSAPYRTETDVLYVRRSSLYALDFDETEDIIDDISQGQFKVAVVDGFYYGPEVDALPPSAVIRTHSDVQNFESLVSGEVDGLFIDQLEGAFISRQFGWDSLVAEYPVPIHQTDICFMFSKQTVEEKTVEDFNQALLQVQESGRTSDILSHYRGSRMVSLLLGTTGQPWFVALDLLGTLAFALSGVALARQSGYDIFGAFVLAALPAVGGGVVRDLLVGRQPVGILSNPIYLKLIAATVILSFLLSRKLKPGDRLQKAVFFLDAVGLGTFATVGVLVAAEYNCKPLWLCGPLLAVLTGAGGGILRDTLRGKGECASLQGDFYPEVALIWGFILSVFLGWYVSLPEYQPSDLLFALVLCVVGALVTRLLAVRFKWRSPLF